jgi:hypothetical protein
MCPKCEPGHKNSSDTEQVKEQLASWEASPGFAARALPQAVDVVGSQSFICAAACGVQALWPRRI